MSVGEQTALLVAERSQRVAPAVFGLCSDLVDALFTEDFTTAQELLSRLTQPIWREPVLPRVVKLDDGLGAGVAALYQRCLGDDVTTRVRISAVDDEELARGRALYDEAISLLREVAPDLSAEIAALAHETVFVAACNLSVALNFERAEKYAFEQLRAPVGIFFEDDLVLSPHYVNVLDHLAAQTIVDTRVGYVACYGNHLLPLAQQERQAASLSTLHHNWGFTEFAPLQQRRYHEMLAELVAWAGKPRAPAVGVEDQTIKACEHIFHEVNAALAQGRSDVGLERAPAALRRLFEGVAPAGRVTIAFEPLTTLPDLTRSSQVRVAVAGSQVRISVPREILAPYFSNYFFPVVMLRRFIRDLCESGLADGAFTLELGDASPTERLPIAAFSATAQSARLTIDEGYFVSGGHAHVREVADRRWRDSKWRSDRVFWRGIASGLTARTPPPSEQPLKDWSWNQRLNLCEHARRSRHADKLDIGLSSLEGVDEEYLQQAIVAAGFIKDCIAGSEILRFRHQIVIDGVTSAGNRLLQAFIQGACVIRIEHPEGNRSWFYDRLDEFDAHIRVKADLSDFDDKLDWVFAHPTRCAELAANARRFAVSLDFDSEWQRSVETLRQLARR